MNLLNIVKGDLLDSNEDIIGHQCNCVTRSSRGLAAAIFHRYPYANDYHLPPAPPAPPAPSPEGRPARTVGTYRVYGDPAKGQRLVLNLYAQYQPGYVEAEKSLRLQWFQSALESFMRDIYPHRIRLGLPHLIGCGLAGGDWNQYSTIIQQLACKYPHVSITIYCKD